MNRVWVALVWVFIIAFAQNYSGTYVMQGQKGPVTLTLAQSGEQVSGRLEGGGVAFNLEGAVDDEGVYGVVYSEQGELYFELAVQGNQLQLILAPFDPDTGKPDPDRAVQYLMTRQAAGGGNNPLAQPAKPNPLAQTSADPFVGSFAGDGLNIVIQGGNGNYSGQIQAGGQTYPLTAQASGGVMQGVFSGGGQQYQFAAKVEDGTLLFQTGGKTYQLQRTGGGGQAAAGNPLAGKSSNPDDPVIARGQYAELTLDNALAFIEAIEFSLQQLGRQVSYGEAEKKQMLEAIVQSYPQGSKQEQVILARARQIWNNAQANWAQTPLEDRREFVTDVLVLAFGEDTTRQLIAEATGGGGGGGGGGVDVSGWGEVSSDISNTTGCWGSNGCSYDSASNTYEYSPDYYSDDY